jgi:hypothetical protein
MKRGTRKCLCCGEIFEPDARNRHHQRYCGKAACQHASRAASQRRWLSKAENRDYFRGAIHVARVQAWRRVHPGYGKRAPQEGLPLQDDCRAQGIDSPKQSTIHANLALQEIISSQPLVLLGLIAHFTDSPLQDSIARTARRLMELGRDVLGAGVPQSTPAGTDVVNS